MGYIGYEEVEVEKEVSHYSSLANDDKKNIDKLLSNEISKEYIEHKIIEDLKEGGYVVYKLDDHFEDHKKEKHYIDFIDKIYDNYENIMVNSDNFFVSVNKTWLRISFCIDESSNAPTREYTIWIRPNSITLHIDREFVFNTTKNYYKEYFNKFREMESHREFVNSKRVLDKFCTEYKLNRMGNIDQILDS